MFPILEFDPTRETLTEPSRLNERRDLPEHAVVCFFKEVIEKDAEEHQAQVCRGEAFETARELRTIRSFAYTSDE